MQRAFKWRCRGGCAAIVATIAVGLGRLGRQGADLFTGKGHGQDEYQEYPLNVGDALTIIADSNRTALVERPGLRVTAEALYHQSADIWGDMRKNGTLSSPDASKFDRLTREIAESHDALKK